MKFHYNNVDKDKEYAIASISAITDLFFIERVTPRIRKTIHFVPSLFLSSLLDYYISSFNNHKDIDVVSSLVLKSIIGYMFGFIYLNVTEGNSIVIDYEEIESFLKARRVGGIISKLFFDKFIGNEDSVDLFG